MYTFIKNLIPSKKQDQQDQQKTEIVNETVQEAKNEVNSVEDVEFEMSLAINKTSTLLDKLEADRKKLFEQVKEIESQLVFLGQQNLNEKQKEVRDKLEVSLKTSLKPTLEKSDKEVDNLTKQLLQLYNQRDNLTQKKVSTEDGVISATKTFQNIDNTSEPLSSSNLNNNNNNESDINNTESNDNRPSGIDYRENRVLTPPSTENNV